MKVYDPKQDKHRSKVCILLKKVQEAVPGCPGWSSHQKSRNNPLGCQYKAWNTRIPMRKETGSKPWRLLGARQREQGAEAVKSTQEVQLRLDPGAGETSLFRSLAWQCMAWTGSAQGHCSGQTYVASSLDGQDHQAPIYTRHHKCKCVDIVNVYTYRYL